MIQEGTPAPDIRAESTLGEFRLEDHIQSGPLVLFFYVKADTPG